jgi:hypothetical protein
MSVNRNRELLTLAWGWRIELTVNQGNCRELFLRNAHSKGVTVTTNRLIAT